MDANSLTVVGTGIRLVSQATPEAVSCMARAEKLLYLVADPVTEDWVRGLNPSAESLADCYALGRDRGETYRAMVEIILSWVRRSPRVCVALYGHPGVFAYPSHAAIRSARREGFTARMLPGISAEDCLFADLGVDPATSGCASFEATDFLVCSRLFDPTGALVLWQVGMIGEAGPLQEPEKTLANLRVLRDALLRHYPPDHEIVLYEAALYPVCAPGIERIPLRDLGGSMVSMLTTLFVPPRGTREPDDELLRRLGMEGW